MPELPEVETTATHLNKEVRNKTIKDVWTDWPKYFYPIRNSPPRRPLRGARRAGEISNGIHPKQNEKHFRKMIVGRKIISVGRKGKNILFFLSGGYIMLAHQKMTGHFLVGRWRENSKKEKLEEIWLGQKWVPVNLKSPLGDSRNRFIRLIFFLSNGDMLALSDLRRFAKIVLGRKKDILDSPELKGLGPEPIDPKFTLPQFQKLFQGKRGKIKQLLLDQNFLSGIGNIYADESLWRAKIHPLREAKNLTKSELSRLFKSIRLILKNAIRLRGSSIEDYRDPMGQAGFYQNEHQAYHRENEACRRCGTRIKRMKIGQRSAHFCPQCQKL